TDYYNRYFPSSSHHRHNFDYGGAVAADFKNFKVQFECVGRSKRTEISAGEDELGNRLYTKQSEKDFQYMGTFSYKINQKIALSYSLGDSFVQVVSPDKTLISMLSLNLGFGGPQLTVSDE